ncbi:MAG TPA: ABC transporter permease [Solirubrobacteraceae bacterium]|nr:ABC transporter permease [Solirubrobacteraceae bacterium]
MNVPGGTTSAADRPEPASSAAQATSDLLTEDWRRTLTRTLNVSPTYMFGVLLSVFIAFTIINPSAFTSTGNLQNITETAAPYLVMAVAVTYLMIAGGLDLSVGSVLVFANVIAAKVMGAIGGNGTFPVLVGLLAGLGVGAGWGLFNGFCVTKLRVPALITTLGTLGAVLGAADLLTAGNDIRSVPLSLINFGTGTFLGLNYIVWIAIGVTLVFGLMLHLTQFGRHTYIVGSNIEAARRAGVNVDRHLFKLYALSGAAAGLAGFLALGQFASTTISGHSTDVIIVITGVVLGGTSLFGGYGWMIGTVIGILIPTTLNIGLVIANVQPFWQQVATGLILIAAVYLDQLKRRSRERT